MLEPQKNFNEQIKSLNKNFPTTSKNRNYFQNTPKDGHTETLSILDYFVRKINRTYINPNKKWLFASK